MGEGLRKATLDALLTRGPWTAKDGYESQTLTPQQVKDLYWAIWYRNTEPTRTAGLGVRGSRLADRALTLLKKVGLIRYVKTARVAGRPVPAHWEAIGAQDTQTAQPSPRQE